MVAKRLAAGDYGRAINGYWSPLHSWLVAPFLKWGVNEFTAFRVSNGFIGLGILVWTSRLLNKTDIAATLKTIALLTCIPIVLSYVFYELAADTLFCLIVLVFIDINTDKGFFHSPYKYLISGALCAVGYFAKTYGFVFFSALYLVIQVVLYLASAVPNKKALLVRNLIGGYFIFFLLVSPWLYLLYHKYGFLTFGYSGELNFKWQLFDRLDYPGSALKAPPYPDSPFTWEDPLHMPFVYEEASTFTLFIRQIRLTLTNFMTSLSNLNSLSFLSIAIILALLVYLQYKRDKLLSLFFLVIIMLPMGYIFIHIESRFLWAITFLLLISGLVLIQKGMDWLQPGPPYRVFYWTLFFASFLVYPVNWLKDAAGTDKDLFMLADQWKAKDIRGKWATTPNGDYPLLQRAAYLTGSQLYIPTKRPNTYDELKKALQEHNIQYFFYFYEYNTDRDAFKQSSLYKAATEVLNNEQPGIIVLKMR
jgi:hypothetical protein